MFSVFVWTGENGCFRKRLRHWHWHVKKKQNGCFLIRFRWSSVDGRKRCKNASVDGKLFIRFQETENGGFRKRISVDRALINTFPCSSVPTVRLYPPFLCYSPTKPQFLIHELFNFHHIFETKIRLKN